MKGIEMNCITHRHFRVGSKISWFTVDRWHQALIPADNILVAIQITSARFIRMRTWAFLRENQHVV